MRRVLLDENLPRLLKRELSGFQTLSVAEAGWAGTRNGALLRRAAADFDVFVAADRSLPYQQTLGAFDLGVVVIAAGSTKLDDLRVLAPAMRQALATISPGQIVQIPAAGSAETESKERIG